MKRNFISVFVLLLSISLSASAASLCPGYSDEEECHKEAYQSIILSLQQDLQSKQSSVSAEEFQNRLVENLPYKDFVYIFQKCENKHKENQQAFSCLRNDIKKFITMPTANPAAKKFLQDTFPAIVYNWNAQNLKKHAASSKLVDDFAQAFGQNYQQLAHSCMVGSFNEAGKRIDVDTGKNLYLYETQLSCQPKNARCSIILIPTSEGYKYFNIDCTIQLGDLGRLEDLDAETFKKLLENLK